MRIRRPAILLLVAVLAGCATHAADTARFGLQERSLCEPPEHRPGWCEWPRDVRTFVDRYDACDHFKGEEPYDRERRAFLEESIRDTCTGNDKELRQLRRRYADDAQISALLQESLELSE